MDILYFRSRLFGRQFRDNWGGSDGNGSNPSAGYSGGVNGWSGGSHGSSADPSSPSFVGPPASAGPVGDPSNPSFVDPPSSANPAGDPSSPSFVGPQPSSSGGLIGQANTSSMPAANTGLASTAANMVNAMQSVNTAEKTATTVGEQQSLANDAEQSTAAKMTGLIGQDVADAKPAEKKAVEGDKTVEGYADVSSWGMKPSWYNHENPGFSEAIHDFTSPDPNSLSFRLGIRGAGMTAGEVFSHETPNEQFDRVNLINKGLNRVADAVIAASPLGTVVNAIKAYNEYDKSQSTDKPMTVGEAIGGFVVDTAGRKLSGMINSEVGKAVGPAMSTANQLGLGYSLATGERSPVPNIGATVVGGIKDGLGLKGTPNTSTVSAPDGVGTMTVSTSGGFSTGGSRNNGSGYTPETPTAPVMPPAANQPDTTNTRVDGRLGLNTAGWAKAVRSASAKRHNLA